MTKTYRSDIDGLRAVAVTAVVFYHAGLPWLSGGFVGVDVFYVISGFLITGLIEPDIAARKFSFAKFYARRTKRILPALFLILLVACGLACLLLGPAELASFARSAVAATFGLSNLYYYSSNNYFTAAAAYQPLLMTWSLGVEEQFYLVYPLLLTLLARLPRSRQLLVLSAITLTSIGISAWSTRTHPTAAFYLLPSRAWELGVGCLLALTWDEVQALLRRPYLADGLGVAGAAMVLAAIACFGETTDFPGWAALLPVAGTALLVATPSGLVNRLLLSSRPAVFVGLLSYSWYLWHWPLMSFARIVSSRPLHPAVPSLLALLALAAAYASWRWVERPFRASRSADAVVLARNACVAAGVAAIAAVFAVTHGLPNRFNAQERAEATRATALAADPCLVLVGDTPNRSHVCMPSGSGTPAMALIGDSHAAVFRQTLAADTAGRYRLLALLKASCPPLLGVALSMPKNPLFRRDCLAFMRAAFDAVAADGDVSTVVLAGYWSLPFDEENAGLRLVRADEAPAATTPSDSRANFAVGLAAALDRLAAAGKRIILVEDPPGLRFNPLRQLMADEIGLRGRLSDVVAGKFPRSGGLVDRAAMTASDSFTASILRRTAAAYPRVEILDPAEVLCAADRCRYAEGERLLYSDERHLTNAGARRVLALLPVSFAAGGDLLPSNHAERP